MDPIAAKKAARFKMLEALYDRAEGNSSTFLPRRTLGEELGLDPRAAADAWDYLVHEGLAQNRSFESISITHQGVKEVEALRAEPDEPSRHFPAINLMHVQTMINSQVQQGSPGSSQVMKGSVDLADLQKFIETLTTKLPLLKLENSKELELRADIETIQAQLKSGRPKTTILGESLRSVRTILEGTAANTISAELVPWVGALLAALGT